MAPRKKSKATKPKETMRQRQMRLRREARAKKLEKGPARVKGGQAPGAGRTGSASASKPKPRRGSGMVNRSKPTMRKLAAKAAQARKRGQGGRPLVRRSELDKANKPSIKRGASALRARANAPKISARMEAKLKAARAGRGLRGLLGKAGRALVPLGMALEIKNIADRSKRDAERNKKLNRRPFEGLRADNYKPNPNRRGQGSGKPASKSKPKPKKTETKPKKTETKKPAAPTTKGLSAGAKAFDKAFAAARSAGKKEFTWRGKRYTTRLKK